MRRMYSEQELTKIIGEVFDQKIEAGAFNDSIADAVDDYLTEHPVDITALEGLDISVGSLTSTGAISGASASISGNASVGGNLPVTGNITGASIIENMSGYSFSKTASTENYTLSYNYVGVCKNGNKLTMVIDVDITLATSVSDIALGSFLIPSAVGSKLIPSSVGGNNYLDNSKLLLFSAYNAGVEAYAYFGKNSNTNIPTRIYTSNLVAETTYHCRYEKTFLLSENLSA